MRIDVHAHYFPAEYLDLLERFGSPTTAFARNTQAGGGPDEIAARLAVMDAASVQLQVLSAAPLVPSFDEEAHAVAAARLANDLYADLVTRYPDRFAAFAVIPLPHVDASLAEMDRALGTLGMRGVTITTSMLSRTPTDSSFAPIFAELDRRGSVLSIHPAGIGARSPLITEYGLSWSIGAPIEDTISITQLIVKEIPTRYPHVKIINAHLGGALPMLLDRLDYQLGRLHLSEPPSSMARRMWYDTVGHGSMPALRCACDALGADRLLLGSDYPYQQGDRYRRAVAYVQESKLPQGGIAAMLDENASLLLDM
jgi:predicted TIM-barrel fold metal-dependent hydrolase